MARWSVHYPEPGNTGEPQSVRDAYDNILKAQAEADDLIQDAIGEIEIDQPGPGGPGRPNGSYTTAPAPPSSTS